MTGRADKPDYKVAFAGAHGFVRFARKTDGTEPAFEFWESLSIKQQAVFGTSFRTIISDPRLLYPNRQKFKQVQGELFEFKSNVYQMRIFCFRKADCWYLTSGFAEKKEDDLPLGELRRAQETMQDCMRELAAFEAERAQLARKFRRP